MEVETLHFTLAEKLAIVHAVDSVILVDGQVHNGEIDAITKLMKLIDFDSNFIMQARNIDAEQALSILVKMPDEKKSRLKSILEMIAISDGFLHEKETDLMAYVFKSMGIEQE